MPPVELLLAALGSARDAGPASMLADHITRLRATGRWGRVDGGFLLAEPRLSAALERPWAGMRVIVPLLMCDGVVSGKILPGLQAQAADGGERVRIAPPVGAAPDFPALVAAEAEALALRAGWVPAETGLLLAAHGTLENPASITATQGVAAALRQLDRFAAIRTGFLSQSPYLGEAAAGFDRRFVTVGLFAAPGGHAAHDVPEALRCARQVFIHLPAIGAVPAMADLIAREARRVIESEGA